MSSTRLLTPAEPLLHHLLVLIQLLQVLSRVKTTEQSRGAGNGTAEADGERATRTASASAKQGQTGLSAAARTKLAALPLDQFVLPPGKRGMDWKTACKGHLDLYSGERGVARELAALTDTSVLTFDWVRSISENLLDPAVQQEVLERVRLQAFFSVGLAPLCSSFSTALLLLI